MSAKRHSSYTAVTTNVFQRLKLIM